MVSGHPKLGRVLVTGSSRGIGRAIALRLARDGWSVAVHYSKEEGEALETANQLGASASGIYQCDLADPDQAPGLFVTAARDGEINALVNNAGIYVPEPFLVPEDGEFLATYRRTMAINLESPTRLMRS